MAARYQNFLSNYQDCDRGKGISFGVRGVSPALDRVERTSKAVLTHTHSKAAETTAGLPDGVGPATSRGLVREDLRSRGCGRGQETITEHATLV